MVDRVGVKLRFEAHCAARLLGSAALRFHTAVKAVTRVELHARQVGIQPHADARSRAVRFNVRLAMLMAQHEVVIVAVAVAQLGMAGVDILPDLFALPEVIG